MYIILIVEDLDHIQVVQDEDGSTKLFYTKEVAEMFEEQIKGVTKIVKL